MKSENNLPKDFEKRMLENYPFSVDLFAQLNSTPPTSIRLHPFKKNTSIDLKSRVPWAKNGYYLIERPVFTLDPSFHAGTYYPQEAGSMYLETILNHLELPEYPLVLDACAAPGGKTSILAEKLSNKGTIISNEVIKSRAFILVETVTKWGFSNQIVTCNDTKTFRKTKIKFDLIVIDAPCSGEGMFRKDQKARDEWSLQNCFICEARQKEILENLLPCLKEEGFLIYSTCTFNPKENEELLREFIDTYNLSVCEMPQFEGMFKDKESIGQYFFPNLLESEGFYCAVLRKNNTTTFDKKKSDIVTFTDVPKFISENPLGLAFNTSAGFVIASNENTFNLSKQLKDNFFILKTGITVSQVFGKKEVPQIDLALTPFLDTSFEKVHLEKPEALKFLKGETFQLSGSIGYKEIVFDHTPLGYINHLGKRFNNLFPNEWRIKMKIS